MKKATGPLAGIRIVDMSSVLMGPYATQILADYGADVIKIEDEKGDLLRMAGAMRSPKMGSVFLHCNRNKRSVVIDAKSEAGYAALMKLCKDADIFVSNVRPAALKRLKMGYQDIKVHKPDIIYVSLVGYGQRGPYKNRPAFDDLMQGISGIPALASRANGGKPQYAPINLADKVAGISAVHAILAALVHKLRTGRGQSVEVPMFEVLTQFVLSDHMGGYSFDPALGPIGYNRLLSPDRRPYETRDGFLSILVYTDGHWKRFFELLGRSDEFERSPMFHDHATRTRSYDEVYSFLAAEIRKKTTAEWIVGLEASDIPYAPMHSAEDLINDPHIKAVDLIQMIDHPTEGRMRMIAPPIIFSETPASISRHPPRLGEHTQEVFEEFGIAPEPTAAKR
jgi:crotonobetainyl-CoA:carnitine CoA-transferase CaiB-like acyl-CoA transferase